VSVQDELDRFAADGLARAEGHDDDYQQLWHSLAAATRAGKRLRPALLLAAYDAYGGRDGDPVVARVAAALELLHTALLIHDDVIDGDLVRRGELNVSGTFVALAADRGASAAGRATFGLTAGVLAGDLALVGATRELALCGADGETTRRLLDLFTEAVHVSAAGELADVALSIGRPDVGALADVITMEEHKTAVYSFQLPLQSGAVLAGADDVAVERLGQVGRLAGIGFQLADDLQGVFGDEARTGKSALGDLREGKMTPLMAHARSTSAWPTIAPHLGDRTLDEERASRVRALLVECGSRDFVEQLADSYVSAALRTAEQLDLAPALLAELSRLSERLVGSAA
jgi:geranylgeranyl diphosphate synthase type II